MFYYTYKITLLKGSLAGHYYYGQHRTKNLNDNYAGSGRIIVDYFKKYGKIEHQTYIKETIAFYNSQDELNVAEYELIGDKYESDDMCLNLVCGGWQAGGDSEITRKRKSEAAKKRGYKRKPGWHMPESARQKLSQYSPWTKGKKSTISGKHRVYREDGSFYFE